MIPTAASARPPCNAEDGLICFVKKDELWEMMNDEWGMMN